LIQQAKIALAGGIAEEVVFGRELASVGRASDRERATILIQGFIRRHGFDAEFQANYMLGNEYSMDRHVTDPDIEKMIARLVAEVRPELTGARAALLDLARELAAAGRLDGAAVAAILGRHGIPAALQTEGHLIVPPYRSHLGDAPA
jgi:ATP-dependent Zn protease